MQKQGAKVNKILTRFDIAQNTRINAKIIYLDINTLQNKLRLF